ncbi:HCLS1-associated protein X-1 isoform X1 [Harpia harpyja]|uniref:HCLS1-associated protein X-1 isoform X1 n=1 Tax=Harpia harpyja TaxID=202280 RepID=UPI0022B150A9|nr:HCLS1-associated protein X-1 isoform X1 [Harpia harpyja]XP_052653739.1 HCLS1-associated protein X-1 isoform X1 [Harpia harpyja]
MSFYDAFRGFFGFPGRRRPRDPLFGGTAWDEEEEEEDGPSLAQPPQDFAFGFSPGGSRGAFEELFRDVGELLGVFGGARAGPPQPFGGDGKGLPPPGAELGPGGRCGAPWAARPDPAPSPPPPPPAEPPLPGPSEGSTGQQLRDSMLKHPESPAPGASPGGSEHASEPAQPWRPFLGVEDAHPAPPSLKEDQDLDSQVSSTGLGTILRPNEPKSHSYFQSVSVTKVTLPDGVVEERRTMQDSQGHWETTVTRRRGDQAFITTTKEDGQSKDYREEVVNMDDWELAQFAGTWPRQDELHTPNLSDPSSALGSFFRCWFSSW